MSVSQANVLRNGKNPGKNPSSSGKNLSSSGSSNSNNVKDKGKDHAANGNANAGMILLVQVPQLKTTLMMKLDLSNTLPRN